MALQNTSVRAIVPMVRTADQALANRMNVFNGQRMVRFTKEVARQDTPTQTRFYAGGCIMANWRDEGGERTPEADYWIRVRNTRNVANASMTPAEAEAAGGVLELDMLPEGTTQQDITDFGNAIILDVHRLQYEDDPVTTIEAQSLEGETRPFVDVAGTEGFRKGKHFRDRLAARSNPAQLTDIPEPAPDNWRVTSAAITDYSTNVEALNAAQRRLLDALCPRWDE